MGNKRTRTRKYFCFFIAGLLVFAIGCTHVAGTQEKEIVKTETKKEEKEKEKKEVIKDVIKEEQKEVLTHLSMATKLLNEGNYEGSLKENQKVLLLSKNNPPGDEALFNMALIYSHHNNPNKEYKRSLDLFNRMIEDYPQSPLVEQAKIWIGVLRVIEESKKIDIEIEKKKKELSK